MKKFEFSALAAADLIVDATYEGDSNSKDIGGEPLGPLTGTGNSGGIRFCGPISNPKLVVLYSTMEELNWPDAIDEEAGLLTYYGDNKKPGFELHDRKGGRGGNQILMPREIAGPGQESTNISSVGCVAGRAASSCNRLHI